MSSRFFLIGLVIAVVAIGSAYAGGAQEQVVTNINIEQQPRQFIGPENQDSTAKALLLPFKTLTIPGTAKVIKSWTFTVFDSNGKVVYSDSKIETRDRGFFGELFNVGSKPQVEIPVELTWNGKYSTAGGALNGRTVPDGAYTYQITIFDDGGNRAQTPPFNVTVKNAPIIIERVSIPVTIFSPTGNRKTVHIDQSGSREQAWKGQIADSKGTVVRTYVWENKTEQTVQDVTPPSFDWDGQDDLGNLQPEGNYTYTLVGQDRTGASKKQTFPQPIQLSLKAGAVRVTADTNAFSPNGDGVLDLVNLKNEISDATGLQSWSLTISDVSNSATTRFSRSGTGSIPPQLSFDGMDSAGKRLPEGRYQAVLSASYDNGNTVTSTPVIFAVDLTAPKVKLVLDSTVFGGQAKPSTYLTILAEAGPNWTLKINDRPGKVVATVPITSPDRFIYEFTGFDKSGKPLADDLYTFVVSGTDAAGNIGTSSVRAFKDSREMHVKLELSQPIIVPNRGTQSVVRITPILDVSDGLERMGISVVDQAGVNRATKSSTEAIGFWDWFGKDNAGVTIPDGSYTVVVAAQYTNGTTASAQQSIIVDSKLAEIQLSLKPSVLAFTPIKGTMSFEIGASPATGIKNWKLSLEHQKNGNVKNFSGAGTLPAAVVWDGRTDNAVIQDGTYTAKLAVSYENGLSGQSAPTAAIFVSSASPQLEMYLSSSSFVPGNIIGPQSLTIGIKPATTSVPIASWELSAIDERGKSFRSWSGTGTPPASIIWDGKSNSGDIVQSGEDYRLALVVRDSLKLETRKDAKVTIDILVVKLSETSYKIIVSSIQFGGNSSDVFKVEPNLLAKNIYVLQHLATVLNKLPDYRIRLEGYAASEYFDDPKTAKWEQETQLIPLSTDRATEVRNALVLLGVDGQRFSVKGYGSERPLVPNSELENRWKNRRVEFYLDKN